jgi:non-ribosomal peptide synthetase component F
MIVGLLGIRSGAAYLPLDAHARVDRIAMMLAEADVRRGRGARRHGTGPVALVGADTGWGRARPASPACPGPHGNDTGWD